MGKPYLIALLMALVTASVYWYKSTETMCPAPLSYRIGDIDSSFGISKEEALVQVKAAEALWEDSVNRDLFTYDERTDFTIDFVFDERQEDANTEENLREELDEKRAENDSVLETVESLQEDFKELSASYEARSDEYEERLNKYNAEVNRYNDRGGAPPDVFKKLDSERASLNREAEKLSDTATQLNDLAAKINKLSERGNLLVDSYNREVNQYNNEFGFSKEFTQGDYKKRHIQIYKFSSNAELVTVLAHEFGHSLGLDHVAGESSLMYYLLGDTSKVPNLSSEDLAAYYEICGTKETVGQAVHRIIRDFLIKF